MAKKRRSAIAKDLRTPKYRMRVMVNKKRQAQKWACRKALMEAA